MSLKSFKTREFSSFFVTHFHDKKDAVTTNLLFLWDFLFKNNFLTAELLYGYIQLCYKSAFIIYTQGYFLAGRDVRYK